jgi:hypothetical protein
MQYFHQLSNNPINLFFGIRDDSSSIAAAFYGMFKCKCPGIFGKLIEFGSRRDHDTLNGSVIGADS